MTTAARTRSEFINQDWHSVDILHISTHGEAFAEVPDAANLLLERDQKGRNTRLHYNDILRSDLCHVKLVILNACLTKFGVQWTGDEDLSLAWAFRAAGARSVIASRWKVPDVACWFFTTKFYDSLLREQLPVRRAFGQAIHQLKDVPLFRDRKTWGTFVLLE